MNPFHEQLTKALVQALNLHDAEAVMLFCSSNFWGEDVGLARPVEGRLALRESVERYLAAFPDLSVACLESVGDGDRLAMRWIARGTHRGWLMNMPPTGRQVTVTGSCFLSIGEGKILRASAIWDVAGLLRGIGFLPELL